MALGIELAERGWIPDPLLRLGIRKLVRRRLEEEARGSREALERHQRAFRDALRRGPVAADPERANAQHYELPAEFFRLVLGRRLKYSGCYWPAGIVDLDAAEEAMLELSCERAGIRDGMTILDLGCGWGSFSLWLAERFPACRILAVSNSSAQRGFILERAAQLRLGNIEVRTADMNSFAPGAKFDRIVSIEMFEHMRNYELLFARIAGWLEDGGRLFVHVFSHRRYAYLFETQGEDDWMGRYFFTGGIMPSQDLFCGFSEHLKLSRRWELDGTHYQKTAEAWLARLDAGRSSVLPVLREAYGPGNHLRWLGRWRLFFLACAELFGYRSGLEWQVTHYLFERNA